MNMTIMDIMSIKNVKYINEIYKAKINKMDAEKL